MPSYAIAILASALASLAAAQQGILGVCPQSGCAYCPDDLLQQGTGYPSCVIYNTADVLGAFADQFTTDNGNTEIFFNIPHVTNDDCRTIIRSPADTDVANCGYPLYAGEGGECVTIQAQDTIMVQFCCGIGDCTKAGAEKRSAYSSGSLTSLVLHDAEGNLIVPNSVGESGVDLFDQFINDMGVNRSSATQTLSAAGINVFKKFAAEISGDAGDREKFDKRTCNKYVADGDPYTALGDTSYVVSDYICDSTSHFMVQNSQSVSRTTTFSATVSDPFGIVSASVGFETEKSASQSYTYEFEASSGECGHVVWTPIYLCTKGQIDGCAAGTQYGDVCTADRISSSQLNGVYAFVQEN